MYINISSTTAPTALLNVLMATDQFEAATGLWVNCLIPFHIQEWNIWWLNNLVKEMNHVPVQCHVSNNITYLLKKLLSQFQRLLVNWIAFPTILSWIFHMILEFLEAVEQEKYGALSNRDHLEDVTVSLVGRIMSRRSFSSKLFFMICMVMVLKFKLWLMQGAQIWMRLNFLGSILVWSRMTLLVSLAF